MSGVLGFTLHDIKYYLLTNGGIVEYHELVKAFRHHLSDQSTQNEARNAFKDYVNRLATVCTQQNQKYLVLRPEFRDQLSENIPQVRTERRVERMDSLNSVGLPVVTEPPIGLPLVDNNRTRHHPRHQMSAIPVTNPSKQMTDPSMAHFPNIPIRQMSFSHHYNDDSDCPPQPPPRRRNSAVGHKNKTPLERFKHFDDDMNGDKFSDDNQKEGPSHQIEKLKEIHELSTQTPGRVKERAQKIDKMASLTELKPPMPSTAPAATLGNSTRPKSRTGTLRETDSDSGSVQTLDPLRKKWIISASNCDYNSLHQFLIEEPKLSSFKDFTNGYTALHWAAKFASFHVIKLLAGTYGVSPNVKSHGGYTPLHLAAIGKHKNIMDILIKTYNADPNIRDNSGKRADQYLITKSHSINSLGKHSNGVIASQRKSHPLTNETNTFSHNSNAFITNDSFGPNLRQKTSHHSLLIRTKHKRRPKTSFNEH